MKKGIFVFGLMTLLASCGTNSETKECEKECATKDSTVVVSDSTKTEDTTKQATVVDTTKAVEVK